MPSEILKNGQRIWERMPDHYIRSDDGKAFKTWLEAFDSLPTPPSNGLALVLREHFQLELSAQFGCLEEPFLSGAIAANFESDQTQDRRFLQQTSEVDGCEIGGGNDPTLRRNALVEPLAAS